MFFVVVRDHMMIAHSLKGEVFGPAQGMHGATYVVDAEFRAAELDANAIVIDIALASRILAETLQGLSYRNLDELPEFAGRVTTTEFLARHVHQEISKRLAGRFRGELKITLKESHVAAAGYIAVVES